MRTDCRDGARKTIEMPLSQMGLGEQVANVRIQHQGAWDNGGFTLSRHPACTVEGNIPGSFM